MLTFKKNYRNERSAYMLMFKNGKFRKKNHKLCANGDFKNSANLHSVFLHRLLLNLCFAYEVKNNTILFFEILTRLVKLKVGNFKLFAKYFQRVNGQNQNTLPIMTLVCYCLIRPKK